jgi:hypothetical protein
VSARRQGASRAVLGWLAWWIATLGLYLALVDTRQYPELVLGAVVATVAASAARAIRASRPLPRLPVSMLLRHLPRGLVRLVVETGIVLGFAARRLRGSRARGRLRAIPFRGGGAGARDVARRALTEGLGSMGPNQIVLGVDRERDLLIVHQLVPDDERTDPLGLG